MAANGDGVGPNGELGNVSNDAGGPTAPGGPRAPRVTGDPVAIR